MHEKWPDVHAGSAHLTAPRLASLRPRPAWESAIENMLETRIGKLICVSGTYSEYIRDVYMRSIFGVLNKLFCFMLNIKPQIH